jgi:hypothetical protein
VKNKFPKRLIGVRVDGAGRLDDFIAVHETPEDLGEEYDGEQVGIYELVGVGKFTVEKQVDGKLFKK